MKNIWIAILLLNGIGGLMSQIQVKNGPPLNNDRDNKMNRMLAGDDNSFYCYRVRSKGKGTDFFVEKYDKSSLKPVFSKAVPLEQNRRTKIEDVEYAQENVYIFSREYDKDKDKMTLYYQTVSSTGVIKPKPVEIVAVTSDHFEFVDFEISMNPSKTKFLVKASHKANKDDKYKTDFILLDAKGMSQYWTKRIDRKLFSESMVNDFLKGMFGGLGAMFDIGAGDFAGLMLDDADNILYGFNYMDKKSTEKERHYKLAVGILTKDAKEEKLVECAFDDDYLVKDVEFSKSKDNEIVMGGFYKDVIERTGRDLVKVGVFSFTIDIVNFSVKSKAAKSFDVKVLMALESTPKKSKYFKYKLDYILPIGNDVFYVGEQYSERYVQSSSNSGAYGGTTSSSSYWQYEYMDVIVAKLNAKGEFEWIKNTPLRNATRTQNPHVFKQYVAVPTANSVYIINNEHAKNIELYKKGDFEPKDLKTMTGIHGSNFVASAVSVTDGSIKHSLIFRNETFCFAPIQERNPAFFPPSDTEIFVPGKAPNEIFVYTEDRGLDRFTKLVIP